LIQTIRHKLMNLDIREHSDTGFRIQCLDTTELVLVFVFVYGAMSTAVKGQQHWQQHFGVTFRCNTIHILAQTPNATTYVKYFDNTCIDNFMSF
jgi:hypothetical protein